jgi:hypothetical protein
MKPILLLMCLFLLVMNDSSSAAEYTLENQSCKITVNNNRITSVFDKIRNVDHGAGSLSTKSLLRIQLVSGMTLLTENDISAMNPQVVQTDNMLTFSFSNTVVTGSVTIALSVQTGEIEFSVNAKPVNPLYAIARIDFPAFETPNTFETKEKFCMTPYREGRLTPISVILAADGEANAYFTYPKQLFSQFIACLNTKSGFLLWTDDKEGYTKDFGRDYFTNVSLFAVKHYMQYENGKEHILSYKSRITFTGPTWQDAADPYRQWASMQPWSAYKKKDRPDLPEILKTGFLGITANIDRGENLINLPSVLRAWKTKYQVPILYRPTGWEKHGVWMGIDYFPSYIGDDKLLKLSQDIGKDGNILATFISGFSWKKQIEANDEKETNPEVLRPATSTRNAALLAYYNSNNGAGTCETDRAGKVKTPERVCRGTELGKNFLLNTAKKMFDLGSSVVHDDVDYGTFQFDTETCFNPNHGHPIPLGLWDIDITRKSFQDIKAEAKSRDIKNFFLSKEYCTEILNQDVHVYQTRFFYAWDDAFVISLSQYIYHEYIFTSFGWPFANSQNIETAAIMIVSGTIPCLRATKEQLELPGADNNIQVVMLKDYFNAMKSYAKEFLSYGKMRRDLIEDAPYKIRTISKITVMKAGGGSQEVSLATPYTEKVPLVTQSTWDDDKGNVGVFAVNMQTSDANVNVTTPEGGPWIASFYIGSSKQSVKTVVAGEKIPWRLSKGRFASVVFTSTSVGVTDRYDAKSLIVFPNPVNDILSVFPDELNEIENIRIYSSKGSMIQNIQMKDFRNEIQVSHLLPGLYLLEVQYKNKKTINKKFIKI